MQEEVENRTVNLAVSTAKLTGRSLVRAVRFFIMRYDRKKQQKKMLNPYAEGKQSVEELLKSGVGTDKIELPDGSAKDFCKLAKQFGVDYAIRKDKTKDPPRYMVFFKAKDTEVLKQVVDEYAARSLQKGEKKSIRKELKAEKENIKSVDAKQKTQEKAKHVKKRKERTEGR